MSFNLWTKPSRSSGKRRRTATHSLRLEPLESRALLTNTSLGGVGLDFLTPVDLGASQDPGALSFTASETGTLALQVDAAAAGVSVFDSTGHLVSLAQSAGSVDTFEFQVVAGQTYHLELAPSAGDRGPTGPLAESASSPDDLLPDESLDSAGTHQGDSDPLFISRQDFDSSSNTGTSSETKPLVANVSAVKDSPLAMVATLEHADSDDAAPAPDLARMEPEPDSPTSDLADAPGVPLKPVDDEGIDGAVRSTDGSDPVSASSILEGTLVGADVNRADSLGEADPSLDNASIVWHSASHLAAADAAESLPVDPVSRTSPRNESAAVPGMPIANAPAAENATPPIEDSRLTIPEGQALDGTAEASMSPEAYLAIAPVLAGQFVLAGWTERTDEER